MNSLKPYLEQHFSSLREQRTGPVFFIEHGLDDNALKEMASNLRQEFSSGCHQGGIGGLLDLPLIVLATEVGYKYRGSGTEYWPLLEKELQFSLSADSRSQIRKMFEKASRLYRGVRPPNTVWAETFRIIAWPITHALVPIEFHQPLAETLANINFSVKNLSDDALHKAVNFSAATSTLRFSSLIHNKESLIPIVRSLLGDETTELNPQTVARIKKDLTSNDIARRSLLTARQIQRQQKAPSPPSHKKSPPIKGFFQVRKQDGLYANSAIRLSLEAVFPLPSERVNTQYRRALRRRRYAPRLWGMTRPIPGDSLLSGFPISIKIDTVFEQDAPLLPELKNIGVDEDLQRFLERLELSFALPLLFAISADGSIGRLIRGTKISGNFSYWLLTDNPLETHEPVDKLGTYSYFQLAPTVNSDSEVLQKLGYTIHSGVSFGLSGPPPLDPDILPPTFLDGDERVFIPRGSYPSGLSLELQKLTSDSQNNNPEEVTLFRDQVARFRLSSGIYKLAAQNGQEFRSTSFSVISGSSINNYKEVCTIVARSDDLTLQSLLDGSLRFAIEGIAPIQNLSLTIELTVNTRKIAASASLGPLPQIVTSNHELFQKLLSEETRAQLLQTSHIIIRLRVGRLYTKHWELENRISPCWWERSDAGYALLSELGPIPHGFISGDIPHVSPISLSVTDNNFCQADDKTYLLLPIDIDVLEHGPTAQFTTLCISPKKSKLDGPVISKPELQRRLNGDTTGIGLIQIVEAYLKWSCAQSDGIIAELHRRKIAKELSNWIIEICCGPSWLKLENSLYHSDPWILLQEQAHQDSLGRDSYLESISDQVWYEIMVIAIQRVRRDLPELWLLARPPSSLGDEEMEVIRQAFDLAYETVAERYFIRDFETAAILYDGDASADFSHAEWNSVIRKVIDTVDLTPLAALLIPTTSTHRFLSLEPSEMSIADALEELNLWAHENKSVFAETTPTPDTLKTIFLLWAEPAKAIHMDWQSVLNTLLKERSIARATRYLALRFIETEMITKA